MEFQFARYINPLLPQVNAQIVVIGICIVLYFLSKMDLSSIKELKTNRHTLQTFTTKLLRNYNKNVVVWILLVQLIVLYREMHKTDL